MSLGEAYINIHADTSNFKRELETQVGAAVAAVESQQRSVTVGGAKRSAADASANAQVKAQEKAQKAISALYTADNKAFAASKAQEVKDQEKAQAAISNIYKAFAAKQAADEKAAAVAREATRKQDIASNKAFVDSYKEGQREIQAAERAAYSEESARGRARTNLARAAVQDARNLVKETKDAEKETGGLGQKLVSLSSALSRIGFTGQTRLITLGLGLGGPIALLGAFTGAAAAATAAVSVFGVQSADAARSATLQFKSLGLSASQAKQQFKDLQDLANKGFQVTNLDADAGQLLQVGLSAKEATATLKTLADIFAANGDVGAVLQKDLDDTSKKLATLVNTAKATPRSFATLVDSLGIGVTAQATFDQLKKNLDVTDKQLDKLIAKGKISGAAVANAALAAASQGTGGALDRAVAESPTQALAAAKSSAQSTLAGAFSAAGTTLAGFISQASAQINRFLAEFAPKVIAILRTTVPQIIAALAPIGNAFISVLPLVEKGFSIIASVAVKASNAVSGFQSQFKVAGSNTQIVVDGISNVIRELGDVLHALAPTFQAVANATGTLVVALGNLEPVFRLIADVINKITGSGVGQFFLSTAAVATVAKLAINGIVAVVTAVGVRLGILTAEETAATKATQALAAAQIELAAALRGTAAASATAGVAGAASGAGGAVGLLGRIGPALAIARTGAVAFTGTTVALGVAAGVAGYAIGNILAHKIGLYGTALTDAQKKQDAAFKSLTDLKFSESDAAKILGQVKSKAGELSDVMGQRLVAAVEAAGGTVGDATKLLIGLGESATNAALDTGDMQGVINGLNGTLASTGFNSSQATDEVNALKNAINSLPAGVAIPVDVNIAVHNVAALAALGIKPTGLEDATGFDSNFILGPDFNAAIGIDTGKPTPTFKAPPGGGGGGGGGASKAKKAADAAKQRAKDFAAALKSITQSINDFADNFDGQTSKQINKAFESIEKSITAAFKADKKNEPSSLVKFLEKDRLELVKDAKQRTDLAKQIAAGDAAALAAIQGAQQFTSLTNIGSTIAEFAKNLLDLSRLHIVLPGDALASGLTTQRRGVNNLQTALDKRLAVLKKFQNDVQTLIHNGLRADLVGDIIAGGADANGALAGALAGASASQIGNLNATQKAITAVTNALGKNAGDAAATAAKNVGASVADGILQGLKDKDKELKKAMRDLAHALTDELKKVWKIKSPSKVAHQITTHFGEGMVNGLDAHGNHLAAAAARAAEAATPRMTQNGIPTPRVGADGYAAGMVVHHHTTHQTEVKAPVTINNYGPAEGVGSAVDKAIGRYIR